MRDFYDALGVDRNADQAAIKAAYRKLALKYHPDRNPDDAEAEANFKDISEAYSILGDSESRSEYDMYGTVGSQQHGPSTGRSADDIFSHFEDVFGDIFGHTSRRTRPARGTDIQLDMSLSFLEAALGCTKHVNVQRTTACAVCSGSGCAANTGHTRCGTCAGRGQVHSRHGLMSIQATCPSCKGAGTRPEQICTSCNGHGTVDGIATVTMQIPAGVATGQRLKLGGMGTPGPPGSRDGDAYVRVFVGVSDKFERDGLDIHTRITISIRHACLGGELSVDTINGPVNVRVPRATQPGDTLTINDAGIESPSNSSKGRHVVHMHVKIPENLTESQRHALEELKFLA